MLVIANQPSKVFKTRRREENIISSFSLSSAPTQKQRNETKRRLEIKNGPHLCFLTDDRDQLKKKKKKTMTSGRNVNFEPKPFRAAKVNLAFLIVLRSFDVLGK